MADWVTGKVTKVQNWTDALFSLTVRAPVLPFTAGQFTKLGLEIDGERVQRAYPRKGDGSEPEYEAFFRALHAGGYAGRVSIEGNCGDFAADARAAYALLNTYR